MENKIISWKAHEFVHYEKNSAWYITFIVLFVLVIGYELILISPPDYFAALTFLILGVVSYFFAKSKPQEIEVNITEQGIHMNDFHVPYMNIKRFWIVDHEEARALHLETNAYINHYLIIQFNQQDPDPVRKVLKNYIVETAPNHETLTHRIARKLKF